MCGLGAAPFAIAVSRDLGNWLLRCLPDVDDRRRLVTFAYADSALQHFYFPRAFLAAAVDPGMVRARIGEINLLARRAAVSSNDVPTLILSLLSSSEPMKGLAPEWRWHSMGGMATSEDYTLPGRSASRLWGLNYPHA